MEKNFKYLIIGQGLVGTWLAYFLQQRNISYAIVNDSSTASATKVASGVMNPVTGRRMVQTWMIEEVLPFAVDAYEAFQEKTNSKMNDYSKVNDNNFQIITPWFFGRKNILQCILI